MINDIIKAVDQNWLDLHPATTSRLAEWETQFGLPQTGMTEAERRARLVGAWRSTGGQSRTYMETTLRGAGFDVYVHEWWQDGTDPPVARNPALYVTGGAATVGTDCGDPLMECGEAFAECGNTSGAATGYLLVNKIFSTQDAGGTDSGDPLMECGEAFAECGNTATAVEKPVEYAVPTDPDRWRAFAYIGGQTFGTLAQVDPKRRNEFEALCLKTRPQHVWLGMLIQYT